MAEQTDTDTIYILSENAPAQIDNMVGLMDQLNLPTGYSRTRPNPTPTQGVWQVERTRRFDVVPLALSQENVLYDKTQASTVALNAATGGEPPITYSLPLVRGSQDRFDVPGAPVTFNPVTRELNIGSGFDEGLEVNYTARDACNQVANARVIIRPSGAEHDDFETLTRTLAFPDYVDSIGRGETLSAALALDSNNRGVAPYTARFQSQIWEDNGWQVSVTHNSTAPLAPTATVVSGDWFLAQDSVIRTADVLLTDFLGRETATAALVVRVEYT